MKNLPYAKIPNIAGEDMRLSNLAFRMLWFIISRPADWEIYNKDIAKRLQASQPTIAKAWKELIDAGYVKREQKHSENGGFAGGFYYEVLAETL